MVMYDDRLEVTSSGSLHFGLSPEDLYREHESMPWNPYIANVFYRRGVIEQWGRGTLKIVELAEQAGLPRPEIVEIPGAVVVRFRPGRYEPPRRVGHDLSERQQEILRLLNVAGGQSLGQIQGFVTATTDREKRRVKEDLRLLKELQLVGTTGRGRGAKWFVPGT